MLDFLQDDSIPLCLREHQHFSKEELYEKIMLQWIKVHEQFEKDYSKLKSVLVVSNEDLRSGTGFADVAKFVGVRMKESPQVKLFNIHERWSKEPQELQVKLATLLQTHVEKFGYDYTSVACNRKWASNKPNEGASKPPPMPPGGYDFSKIFGTGGGSGFSFGKNATDPVPKSFLLVGFGIESDIYALEQLGEELKSVRKREVSYLTNMLDDGIKLEMTEPTSDPALWLFENFNENFSKYETQILEYLHTHDIGCVLFSGLPYFRPIFEEKKIPCLYLRSCPSAGSAQGVIEAEVSRIKEMREAGFGSLPKKSGLCVGGNIESFKDLKKRFTFIPVSKKLHGSTGFMDNPSGWFLPTYELTPHELPEDLQTFLFAAKPPVFVSFRYQNLDEPVVQGIIKSLRDKGQRIVFYGKSFSDTGKETEIFVSKKNLLPLILPKCSFTIHCGDFISSMRALQANKKSLVVPFSKLMGHQSWGEFLVRTNQGLIYNGPPSLDDIMKQASGFNMGKSIVTERGGAHTAGMAVMNFFTDQKAKAKREAAEKLISEDTNLAQLSYLICRPDDAETPPVELYSVVDTLLEQLLEEYT